MQLAKKRYFALGLIVGLLVLFLAVGNRPAPELHQDFDRARLVEVLDLRKQAASPLVKGYGRVAPKHVWQAIAEVNGIVTFRHPLLETGRFLKKDTLVLQIDPLEYELVLAQAEANLNSSKAQLTQLQQQETNLNSSLSIERQKLELSSQEYKRKQSLFKQGLISSSEVENQKQSLLVQTNLVQELESQLKLLPDDRKVTRAQIKINQAKLDDAQRKLEKTELRLPFDARIASVNSELEQAVTMGGTLFEAHQLGQLEIKAELSLIDMRSLALSFPQLPRSGGMPSIEKLDLQAEIQLQAAQNFYRWPARVTRVAETVNPDQATIGVYLEVEQDFAKLNLIEKPPLATDLFVSALITGFESQQFIVPEKALHENHLYVFDEEQQLRIVPVEILFRTQAGVAVTGNLEEGSKIILNDLIPAVSGMKLALADGEKKTREKSAQGENE